MSDREIAQKVLAERKKSQNPSLFDTIGAFNRYYNDKTTPSSLALPVDIGKYIPDNERSALINAFDPTTRSLKKDSTYYNATLKQYLPTEKEPSSFWQKVGTGLERSFNLVAQGISFGLLLGEDNNPLYRGAYDFNRVKESWEAARNVSPGQALMASDLNLITPLIQGANTLTGNKADDFIKSHILFAANDFDIYNKSQRDEAFKEQWAGKVPSFTADFLARWFADPTVIAGKGVKLFNAWRYGVKSIDEFKTVLAGESLAAEGIKGAPQRAKEKAIRLKFQDFLDRTDNMNEQELYRIKAVRESSDPATLVDLLSTANKIDDKLARQKAKTDLVHMAMGDADAFVRLADQNTVLAAKVGSLLDEVPDAAWLTGKLGPNKQKTFDFYNDGAEYERNLTLIAEHEDEIANIYKQLKINGAMDPNKVPFLDMGSDFRRAMVASQNFIDMRAGFTGPMVRFHTGFFYKRPRTWVDFTDNSAVQTVDNQLSRVRGLSEMQQKVYQSRIDDLNVKLTNAVDETAKTDIRKEIERTNAYMAKATFTVERRNKLFQKFIEAQSPEERAMVHDLIEAEIFSTIGRQFGYSNAEIQEAYSFFTTKRQRYTNLIKERAYTGATDPVTGAPVGAKLRPIVDEDGLNHVFPLPINETQLLKQKPVLDIDTMYKVLKRYHRADMLEDFNGLAYNTYRGYRAVAQGTNMMIDALDDFLKFQVLARLGYPIRNVTEGNLRVMSVSGAMILLAAAGSASKRAGKGLLGKVTGKNAVRDALEDAERVRLEAMRLQLAVERELAEAPDEVDARIAEIDAILEGKKIPTDEFGVGEIEMFGLKLQDAKGLTAEQAAFYNEKYVANASRAVDANFNALRNTLTHVTQMTGDWVKIPGTDANWEQAYLRVVNQQIRGSKIASQYLDGKSIETVIDYLTKDPTGREIAKKISRTTGKNAREIAEENYENVRHLFPEWAVGLRDKAAKGRLNADDIKSYFSDTNRRPEVNGTQIAAATERNPIAAIPSYIADKFYKYAGEVPESTLVRSPLYVDLYRRRLAALVSRAIETTKGDTVDPRYLRSIESKARQWARSEMRRTVYDVSEKTDAAYQMKYIFPFFGAFSDVLEKWSRIVVNDPSTLRRLNIVYEAPDRAGMVEERDGITYINFPGEWTKRIGIDRTVSIPKPSLNLLFQGGAWWNPGAGWFVQFAASQLLRKFPEQEKNKIFTEILPYGATDRKAIDLVLQSSAARKAWAAMNESDPMRARLTALIAAEESTRFDLGERTTAPTKAEINEKAIRILMLGVVTSATMPAAVSYRSPYQLYIDEYHRLREENPDTAAEQFYAKYGDDYYDLTVSLSKNNTGIAATLSAYQRSKELSDLIAEQPEYGWFLVGDANKGEFSPTVYGNQYEDPIAPGSTINFRGLQDPYEAIASTQAEKGWITYRKGMAMLEAERINGGFKSINSKGAEYLKDRKQAFVAALSRNNPSWADEYGKIDTNKVNKFLNFANKVVNDPRVSQRQDMITLKKYIQGREFIRRELSMRNSQSIDAQENLDLRERWDSFVGLLLDKDVTFERVYSRMLEKDDLTKGLL